MTRNIDSDPNLMWDMTTKYIKNIAKEILGESKGIELLYKKLSSRTRKFKLPSRLKGQITKFSKRLGTRKKNFLVTDEINPKP